MKVELEPIGGEPGTFTVRGVEEGSSDARGIVIGRVKRDDETSWTFTLKPEKAPDTEAIDITLIAATEDELRAVIRDRFGLMELPADRLTDDTMRDAAVGVMRTLATLAATTKTVPGFSSALVHHLGLIAALSIKPEHREDFFANVNERVRFNAAEALRAKERADKLRDALAPALDALVKGDNEPPTRH